MGRDPKQEDGMVPEEVRAKEFKRSVFGYSPQEVKIFLEQAAEEFATLQGEIQRFSDELDRAQRELRDYHEKGRRLEAALTQTKSTAEEIKTNAKREAEIIVAEAELQAEKILGQTHNRLARLHEDISELKRQRTQFEVRLRSLVEAHLKLLDVEGDRDREMAELEDKIKILRTPSS
jgi:cell division initiation protein